MSVELNDVKFRLPDFSLGPINFTIENGTISTIMGKNGSGKSTTLKLIHGDTRTNSGSIKVDGVPVSEIPHLKLARKFSFVWQEINDPLSFTVRDVMNVHGYSRGLDERSMHEALSRFGMEDFIDRNFSMLSGGERRLVTIASAIYQDSDILIMDEPTNFLDIDNQILVYRIMRELRDAGKTLILSMHDIDAIHSISDSVLILKSGAQIASGPTEETLSVENLRKAFNVPFYTYETVNGKSFVGHY
ncbi:MAG: ABC transporter ATP-binding protein [Candidatus Thermoplasmatota archaeon]|nr:ABC transporter ATP-binding protein [Candidatus Thermoplasmatota archaeon]